jgi:hypothetical protein
MSNQLVCNSFDDQYKKIQSFRNQYLNMIRLVLKHKNHLTFEEIMDYNMIESKLTDILNNINNYTKELKTKTKTIKTTKITKQSILPIAQEEEETYNHDTTMAETLVTFLPYMILYYNHLQTVNILTIPLD